MGLIDEITIHADVLDVQQQIKDIQRLGDMIDAGIFIEPPMTTKELDSLLKRRTDMMIEAGESLREVLEQIPDEEAKRALDGLKQHLLELQER